MSDGMRRKSKQGNKAGSDDCGALLRLVADIRAAVGDPTGKLMQEELVQHCRKLREDHDRSVSAVCHKDLLAELRDRARETSIEANALIRTLRPKRNQVGISTAGGIIAACETFIEWIDELETDTTSILQDKVKHGSSK